MYTLHHNYMHWKINLCDTRTLFRIIIFDRTNLIGKLHCV